MTDKPTEPPIKRSPDPRLQRFREHYARVNAIVRGDAQERADRHHSTLQDWLEHRKEASE